MTNTFAGAIQYSNRRGAALVALILSSVVLAGCESGAMLGTTGSTQPETSIAQLAPTPARTRISVAPVIGAPDGISKQLAQDFTAAIAQKNVIVVGAQDKADYALRGYVVAAKDKAAVKVSYIWDVTDPGGRRVNRVTGEEIVTGSVATDPWVGVTPQVTQAIAQKSAGSLASWLAQQAPVPVAAVAPASGGAGAGGTSAVAVGALPPTAPATPATTTTRMAAAAPAAAASGPIAAVIPSLIGASGDGNNALAAALQIELTKNGVGSANQGGAPYRVEGVVKMGAVADGKQPVQIDWNVKDPDGKRLGTVTQKNEIVAGSLDGNWGRTADAAASAAAQGILKLLPRNTASN